jgi:hypothetical protein
MNTTKPELLDACEEAFEAHRKAQGQIPGMQGLNARPCFKAGWDAALSAIALASKGAGKPVAAMVREAQFGIRETPEDAIWGDDWKPITLAEGLAIQSEIEDDGCFWKQVKFLTPTAPVLAAEAASVDEDALLKLVNEFRHACEGVEGHAVPQWRAILAHVSALANSKTEAAVLAKEIHYPACWDTAAYPTLADALNAVYADFLCQDESHSPAAPIDVAASVGSVDSPKFRHLMALSLGPEGMECDNSYWDNFVAHINANTAAQVAKATEDLKAKLSNAHSANARANAYIAKLIGEMVELEAKASQPAAAPATPSIPVLKEMVNRFLGMPLPKTFNPDCGIRFDGRKDDEWNKNKTWPIGTNLFTADEARQVFEYCLAAPQATQPKAAPSKPYGGDPAEPRDDSDRCTNCGLHCPEGACIYGKDVVAQDADALKPSSKQEVEAFEKWAADKRYDMTTHPLHWLFLNERTHAARQGWNAALEFERSKTAPAQPAPSEQGRFNLPYVITGLNRYSLDMGSIVLNLSAGEFVRYDEVVELVAAHTTGERP